MRKTGIIAAAAAVALALSACGGSQNSGKHTKLVAADYKRASYDELKKGGTLTTAIQSITEQQNPFHQDSTADTTDMWYWYNPQLALFDEKGNYKANPDYFTDVSASQVNGNTVVTYKIREEAKFNDGTPIDYKAFENTWKANNGQDPAYQANSTDGYVQIKSVKAGASAKEAVVTFDGVYSWWQGLFNLLLHPAVDTPEKYNTLYKGQVHPEWGAGPYKVENVAIGTSAPQATFVPNEKWWGKPGKLTKRVMKQMEDQASLNAFLNGEIDATGVGTGERLAAVKGKEGTKDYTSFRPQNVLLTANSASQGLSDPKVREAVFKTVDRKLIANIVFKGLDYSEPFPGSLVQFSIQDGYRDNLSKAVTLDVKGAKKLLDEAGWKEGKDGVRVKDGKKLELRYPVFSDDPNIKNIAVSIQSDLKNVGISLKIEDHPSSDFAPIMSKKQFDLVMSSFVSTDPYGVAYFRQTYASDSTLNKSGTGSKEFDAKIAEMEKIADPKKQIAKANELEAEALKFYGVMPVYNGATKRAVKEKVANYGAMGFVKLPIQNIGFVK